MASFDEVLKDCTKLGTKIPTSEYLESGKYPIIDQGQNDIAGYYDSDDGLFEDVPTIVFGDHTRVVKYVDKPCFLGADGVKLLCPLDKDINCKYLFYQLSCADIPNTGYNRHFKWVKALDFKIPSSDEQNHVVEVLDKVTELISLRKQQLAKLDELVKARFVEMFGTYPKNENGFPVAVISDVANVSVGVVIKPAQYYVTEECGIKAFRSLNIGEMYIKDSDWVYFSTEGNESNKKSQLHENDLLIVRSGAPGTSCVVTKEFEGCNAVDVIIAHPNLSKVNPWYLCAYINYPHGKKQIEEGTGGAAQQHFNVGKCNNLKVLLPPLEPQNQFAAFVERVNQQKQTVQQSLEKLELMKKALMQEYFG